MEKTTELSEHGKILGEAITTRALEVMQGASDDVIREKVFFTQLLENNKLNSSDETKSLIKCTPLSLQSVWLEGLSLGLSWGTSQTELYAVPYKGVAKLMVSPLGLLKIAVQTGAIKSYTHPIIIYKDDEVEIETHEGVQSLSHKQKFFADNKISEAKGVYMYVTINDGTREGKKQLFLFTTNDWVAWGDPIRKTNRVLESAGMLKSKCIKHALKRIPISNKRFIEAMEIANDDTIDVEHTDM